MQYNNQLQNIYNIIEKNYLFMQKEGIENKALKNYEEELYSSVSIDDLCSFVFVCDSFTDLKESLFHDIKTCNKYTLFLERMLYKLRLIMHLKLQKNNRNVVLKDMFLAFQNSYFISTYLEYIIRIFFLDLLNNHIKASTNMSDTYINYLINIQRHIKFKYQISKDYYILIKDFIVNHCESYVYENFHYAYFDDLIISTFKKILSYSDAEYENDNIYALGMAYQILLRSLFIIMNDDNRLSYYEQIYNDLESNDTIGKSIIRMAFISNYQDIKDYKKKKGYKEE